MENKYSPESILQMARNFQEARLLLTGAELDVFTLLEKSPMTAEEVTAQLKGNLRGVAIFLNALSAMGFLKKENDRFQTDETVAPLLSSNAPASVLPMVKHGAQLWYSWGNLTDIVAGKEKPVRGDAGKIVMKDMKSFIGAMHVVGSKVAPSIVEKINPAHAEKMIDVGGGSGTYTIAFLKASPSLSATLFDLSPVIEWARERLVEEGMLDRVDLVAGDFYKDELPYGHDLAFISAIIHQNSPEQNGMLYEKTYRCLNSGGRVIIRDHVMSPDGTSPPDGALFAINMLVNTDGGKTYTYGEIEEGLIAAGFSDVRQINEQGMFSLVEAFK